MFRGRRALAACTLGVGLALWGAPALAANAAPRIVTATMLDRDGDDRADALRLTYSEKVWHRRDTDGRYPFAVAGYTVESVGAARGTKRLVLVLTEHDVRDVGARPAVTYTRTTTKPVSDRRDKQAAAQTYAGAVALDRDGDGWAVDDCAPDDITVSPGAADSPDLAFLDTDCDGIDGTAARAVFVSPDGADANPGTMAAPLRSMSAALDAVSMTRTNDDIYLAVGTYELGPEWLVDESGVYGGYTEGWGRSSTPSTLTGGPDGLTAIDVQGVTLQLLDLTAGHAATNKSSTALSVLEGSVVTLEAVDVTAGNGGAGSHGTPGVDGDSGGNGGAGGAGSCDGAARGPGGTGSAGTGGATAGGSGGEGGAEGAYAGAAGTNGAGGAKGGAGGTGGNPGRGGQAGANGGSGTNGYTGISSPGIFTLGGYLAMASNPGATGTPGSGGGGGGGGGGQGGTFVDDGTGNGGGGGGAGGAPGTGATAGHGGGGSIGIYVWQSVLTVIGSTVTPGHGGAGGDGAAGGAGGSGGTGGWGGQTCLGEIGPGGKGGNGGWGGNGGSSGAGAGGPSIGVVWGAGSLVTVEDSAIGAGTPGAGGTSPAGGSSNGDPGISDDIRQLA